MSLLRSVNTSLRYTRTKQLCWTLVFAAQVQGSVIPSVYDVLARHGVARSEPALIRALRSKESEVRLAAAHVLASEGDREAVPAILEAAQSESEARINRVQLALLCGAARKRNR